MEKEKVYNLHLRLPASEKEQLEAEASLKGFSTVNSYVNYLVEEHISKNDTSQLERITDTLFDLKRDLVDISYYQAFVAYCSVLFLSGNGAHEAVEYALDEVDKAFLKSRYREPMKLEKLPELTDTIKKMFTQNDSESSTPKPSAVSSSQQTPEPVKQKTINDLEYNEIMIDPKTKIPYRRVTRDELVKCKNVPRKLLNQYLEIWKNKPDAVFESNKIIVPGKPLGTTNKLYKSDLDGGYIRVMEDK